jgi:uncharacterized membrane protein YebE (DUF533 family)
MRQSLEQMVAATIADGKVDEGEVTALRQEIYADGKVEKEEVEALFQINDACTDGDNHPSFKQLMADAVCDCVLADDVTPGEVSAEEAEFLCDLLMADGSVDDTEKFVLQQIRAKATKINADFDSQLKALGI